MCVFALDAYQKQTLSANPTCKETNINVLITHNASRLYTLCCCKAMRDQQNICAHIDAISQAHYGTISSLDGRKYYFNSQWRLSLFKFDWLERNLLRIYVDR